MHIKFIFVNNFYSVKNTNYLIGVFFFIFSCTPQSEQGITRVFGEVNTLEQINFDQPLKRFKYFNNFFCSYDFYTKAIYKHNKSFEIIDTLGRAGDASYENRMVRNYTILNDNTLAIFDTEKNSIKIQDWNDSVYYYHKFKQNLDRGELLNDSILITSGPYGSRYKMGFAYTNLNTNEYKDVKFANDILNEDLSFFTYEGILIADGKDLYNFSYNYTEFLKVSLHDSSIIKLNYGYPLEQKKPKVFEIAGGFATDDNPQYIMDVHIDTKFIWILSNVSEKGYKNNRVLDIYAKTEFKYLKSYILPNIDDAPPVEVFNDDDYCYLRYESSVLKMKLDNSMWQ